MAPVAEFEAVETVGRPQAVVVPLEHGGAKAAVAEGGAEAEAEALLVEVGVGATEMGDAGIGAGVEERIDRIEPLHGGFDFGVLVDGGSAGEDEGNGGNVDQGSRDLRPHDRIIGDVGAHGRL